MWVPFLAYVQSAIKGFRMSPDAFVQQALQAAGLLYFGRPVLTYESGSTRRFQFGRCIVLGFPPAQAPAQVARMFAFLSAQFSAVVSRLFRMPLQAGRSAFGVHRRYKEFLSTACARLEIATRYYYCVRAFAACGAHARARAYASLLGFEYFLPIPELLSLWWWDQPALAFAKALAAYLTATDEERAVAKESVSALLR